MMRKQVMVALAMLIAVSVAMVSQKAMADGTDACTVVTNTASVEYEFAGATDSVSSPGSDFTVSQKVDVSVVRDDLAAVQVAPNAVDMVLSFTVTNLSNEVHDYQLSTNDMANGTADPFVNGDGPDNFDVTSYAIYVEDGTTPGFQSAEDTLTDYIDELGNGATAAVYIVSVIPGTVVDADFAVYPLIAQTLEGGGVGVKGGVTAEGSGTICGGDGDIIFGDDDGDDDNDEDGTSSDRDAYIVASVTLNVTKTNAVIWDPINLAVTPIYIPGAIVEYTVRVTYTAGSGTATNVSLSDNLFGLEVDGLADAYGGTGEVHRTFDDVSDTDDSSADLDATDPDVTWQPDSSVDSPIVVDCGADLDEVNDYCEITFQVTIQ